MNGYLLTDAMSLLDPTLLQDHLEKKEALRIKQEKKRRRGRIAGVMLAACFCMVCMTVVLTPYAPSRYDLNYQIMSGGGKDHAFVEKAVWIYYVEDARIKRERVILPFNVPNLLVTWQYLNRLEEEECFLTYEIHASNTERITAFEGAEIAEGRGSEDGVIILTLSETMWNRADGDALISSLERTLKSSMKLTVEIRYGG